MKTAYALSISLLLAAARIVQAEERPATLTFSTVWESNEGLTTLVRPTKTGFVAVGYPRTKGAPPELVVHDVRNTRTSTVTVEPLPEMKNLVLRLAEQGKGDTFVASAAWIEKSIPRNGLLRISAKGEILNKSGFGISIGQIAVLDNGLVAATIQPPRDPESPDPDRIASSMLGFFAEDTGQLVAQSGSGVNQFFTGYGDQLRDLIFRTVSSVPGGVVLCQPRFAAASWVRMPDATELSRAKGKSPFVGGEVTWFEAPKQGPLEVIGIAPIGHGAQPDYVVAWGRKRADALSYALNPEQKYDEIVVATYRNGGRQRPTSTTAVPTDLWALMSDGRRAFILAGKSDGWRIDEVHLH